MLRTVAGIILGYVIFAGSAFAMFQLTHNDPHALASLAHMVLSTLFGIVFAVLGGYLAAVVARRTDLRAPVGVAVLIAVGAALSIVTQPDTSHWTQLVAIVLMAPAAVLGGVLRTRLRRPA